MNYLQYSKAAVVTLKRLESLEADWFHMQLGFLTEVGEIGDAFKKFMIYGKPLDFLNVVEEAGDCMWYLINMWVMAGFDPEDLEDEMADWAEQNPEPMKFPELIANLTAMSASLFFTTPEEAARADISTSGITNAVSLLKGVLSWFGSGASIEKAFDVNIVKLNAKRYAKEAAAGITAEYSDIAAQIRDVGGEREAMRAAYDGEFDMTGLTPAL